jgi:FMN-dependent NADH-azoreductase
MTLFRLDASIRIEGSHSREIADIVEQEWHDAHPDAPVVRRHVGVEPVPATAWASAVSAGQTPASERSAEQSAAVDLAAVLAGELLDADALLFAVPLYNFGVSQHFKAWVDLVLTDPRLAPGQSASLAGRPAVLVLVRGGSYAPGTPRDGWDHASGWIKRILIDVWQLDVKVVETEFTLAGVNPALADFKDLAIDLRKQAELVARAHGRTLGASARAA